MALPDDDALTERGRHTQAPHPLLLALPNSGAGGYARSMTSPSPAPLRENAFPPFAQFRAVRIACMPAMFSVRHSA